MKQHLRTTVLFSFTLMASLLLPHLIYAQNGGFNAAFSRLGIGARGMGMGNAMSSVTTDGIYPHYNPAMSAFIVDGNEGSINQDYDLSTALMEFDRSLYMATATFEVPPTAGLNLTILSAHVDKIENRTQSGYFNGYFQAQDLQIAGNFGINITENFKMGFGIKVNYANYHPDVDAAYGLGLDIGMIYQLQPGWNLSLVVKDMLMGYRWDVDGLYAGSSQSSGEVEETPLRIIAGTSYDWSEIGLLLSADYEMQSNFSEIENRQLSTFSGIPNYRSTRDDIITDLHKVKLGARYRAHTYFTVRTGYQILNMGEIGDSQTFSGGFSVHLPFNTYRPSVDYAFVSEPGGVSSYHVVGLKFNF